MRHAEEVPRPATGEVNTGIQYVLVTEQNLTPGMREAIADVFPPEWFPEDEAAAAEIRKRAWFQAEPYARVLAYDAQGTIIGQTGLVDVSASEVTVHGLSDVALLPEFRGQGIGGKMLRRGIGEAQYEGAEAILAATVEEAVVHTLETEGFRDAQLGEFYFELFSVVAV